MLVAQLTSEEWNARRESLEKEMIESVERLLMHMGADYGMHGEFTAQIEDGRTITLKIDATPRPKTN